MRRPVHVLVASLLLLVSLAPGARAQQALDEKYDIAKELGDGAYKTVHAVTDHPDLAIGILHQRAHEDTLTDERNLLEELSGDGVPAARVLKIGTYLGERAYLMKRFVTGDRAPDWQDQKWRVLNETTLEDMKTIRRALKKAHKDVWDAQFLVDREGHIVVADPLGIVRGVTTPGLASAVLDRIEQDTRAAIQQRKARASAARTALRAMPEAGDEVLGPYFKDATVAPPTTAKERTGLKEALLQFLETPATTKLAQEVAAAVRKGELAVKFFEDAIKRDASGAEAVGLALDRSFPMVAADLVREGSRRLHDGEKLLVTEVKAAAHALAFLRAKNVPEEAVNSNDPVHERAQELAQQPADLVNLLADDAGLEPKDAESQRLAGLAQRILDRKVVDAPRTGMADLLGERLNEREGKRGEK